MNIAVSNMRILTKYKWQKMGNKYAVRWYLAGNCKGAYANYSAKPMR